MIKATKNFFSSKLGWTFVALHFIAAVYAFWGLATFEGGCGPFAVGAGWVNIAGTSLHWGHESLSMQILLLLDLFAIGIPDIILDLFGARSWCHIQRSWTLAILGLFFASIQWYVVGVLIQKMFGLSKTTSGQVE